MVSSYSKSSFTTLLVFSLLLATVQLGAMRPLDGEQWLAKNGLAIQSLQRGPVTWSGHSPCTNIPGREKGVCKLGSMNTAGNVIHSPPAIFPSVIAEFGVASAQPRGVIDQHKSS